MKIHLTLFFLLTTICMAATAQIPPLDLNGTYDFLPGQPVDSPNLLPEGAQWGTCPVPALWREANDVSSRWRSGPLPEHITASCGWYRTTFEVPSTAEGWDARLEVEAALWGCEAWLNGKRLGKHVGGYAPFGFECGKALRAGEKNTLIFKLDGWSSIPRDSEDQPLITVGVDATWANKSAGFTGDVKLKFYRDCRIEWIHLIPNIEESTVKVRISIDSTRKQRASLSIDMQDQRGQTIISMPEQTFKMQRGSQTFSFAPIKVDHPKLWTPDIPYLYTATIRLSDKKGEHLDEYSDRFGFRSFDIRERRTYLNNKPFRLFGSSLFEEPRFKRGSEITQSPSFARRYLVDIPKKANMNCLRTHLGPMNERWLNVCDEGGMTLILEFPVFYFRDDQRFKDFVMKEYEALLPRLWNHPSILLWSISNEGWNDSQREFENTVVTDWFKQQDPTRPVMRAGDQNRDIADIHTYEGVWYGTMNDFLRRAIDIRKQFPTTPAANSEFLETGGNTNGIWYDSNRAKRFMNNDITPEGCANFHAALASEQAEILRRLGYQIILPYWYADWVNLSSWAAHANDPEYPQPKPTLEALSRSFSPVGFCIDLENHNAYGGQNLPVPITIMNDRSEPLKAQIQLKIREGFASTRPVPISLPPHGQTQMTIPIFLPEVIAEVPAQLDAILVRGFKKEILSTRNITIAPPFKVRGTLPPVLFMGHDPSILDFLLELGVQTYWNLDTAPPETLILYSESEEGLQNQSEWKSITERVREGARCIVLRMKENTYNWEHLPKTQPMQYGTDYLFASDFIFLPSLKNPNGLTPALQYSMETGPKDEVLLSGYGDSSGKPTAALVKRKYGEGDFIFCQVELANRISENSLHSDPQCRNMLMQLLTRLE